MTYQFIILKAEIFFRNSLGAFSCKISVMSSFIIIVIIIIILIIICYKVIVIIKTKTV